MSLTDLDKLVHRLIGDNPKRAINYIDKLIEECNGDEKEYGSYYQMRSMIQFKGGCYEEALEDIETSIHYFPGAYNYLLKAFIDLRLGNMMGASAALHSIDNVMSNSSEAEKKQIKMKKKLIEFLMEDT